MAVSIQAFVERFNQENRESRIQQLMVRESLTRPQAEDRYASELGDVIEAAIADGEVDPTL